MHQTDQILNNALNAFKQTTGIPADVIAEEVPMPAGYADAEIRLGDMQPLIAEVKKTLRPTNLGAVLAHMKRFNRPGILITEYMTPQMAEKLKEMDIPFLDVAGNAYLKAANTFVYITGRKQPKELTTQGQNRAFRAAGLKVIFTLLTLKGQLKAPTREIAYNAGVANGTVGNVLKDLERLGFVYRSKTKGIVIENRGKMIDNWVEAYPRELRPQLKAQRFQILHTDWWQEFTYDRWQKNQMWLGGEPAAEVLTKYLHAEKITVYGRPDFKKLAQVIQEVGTGNTAANAR